MDQDLAAFLTAAVLASAGFVLLMFLFLLVIDSWGEKE